MCVYMLYMHRFSTAFCFHFVHSINIDCLKSEKKNDSPYPVKSFVCFLFCISNGVRTSLCFWRKKAIFFGKQGGLKDYVCSEEIDFSQRVCFTRLRLTSMWALYTLKWTLVTLVLMGHYLTCESLRHNQLYFTCKDYLSDGRLSPYPLLPHTPSTVHWELGLQSWTLGCV